MLRETGGELILQKRHFNRRVNRVFHLPFVMILCHVICSIIMAISLCSMWVTSTLGAREISVHRRGGLCLPRLWKSNKAEYYPAIQSPAADPAALLSFLPVPHPAVPLLRGRYFLPEAPATSWSALLQWLRQESSR